LRKFAALPHGPHARKPRAVGILVFLPQSGNQGSKQAASQNLPLQRKAGCCGESAAAGGADRKELRRYL
jgi:hypothetical protein